jgi:drug/metabolite transporter (DMT)-like permease
VLAATILALSSAVLHASWNLFVKTSNDRDLAAWGQFLFAGVMVLPILLVIGWPEPAALPYLVGSALVHVVYVTALVAAYHHGDFSLAYPLARGGGAVMAAFGGVLLLGDVLQGWSWVAIAIVVGGLVSLIRPGTSWASIGWALLTAAMIGTYTLIDSRGARLSSSGVQYGFGLMPFTAISISVTNLARGRGPAFVATLRRTWWRYAIAGSFLTVAYTLVLVAVRFAPVGYVTMLRESSVVMGALAGWVILHERLGRHRVVSSVIIVAGLILLIVVDVGS